MNNDMLLYKGLKLEYHKSRNDDGTNNGSLFVEKYIGQRYCIAKAPKYASDEEWEHNAKTIIAALESYNYKT
jgi:hypothetical protein